MAKILRLALALAAAEGFLWPAPAPNAAPAVYRARRDKARKALNEGVTVLFGRTAKDSSDLRSAFFQQPDFYYLTGSLEPGAILLIAPERGELPREILFLPRRDAEREKWTGAQLAPDDKDIRVITGFDAVLPAETFESELRKYLDVYARLYTLTDLPAAAKLSAMAPLREIADCAQALARLRMEKSPEEIALIQHATDLTVAAHRAAWKKAAPGLYEYQVAAALTAVYFDGGCERSAYAPIVGSGPNATVLHYSRNSRQMKRGELLLMDAGAECAGYATDVTRTIPVGAKFSARQREIYDIVLGAQKAAIAAVKPGMTLGKTTPNSLYRIAYDYIDSHGKDLHGECLGKYFIHGLGHHVGLEVHDASDANAPLAEGMVITIEPGIYIPEENIGIRIEDTVLVTKDGCRVMSAGLPKEAEEIEKAIVR